jgi:hypothetical protein
VDRSRGEFHQSFYSHVQTLRSFDPRLTLGGPLLCSLILLTYDECVHCTGAHAWQKTLRHQRYALWRWRKELVSCPPVHYLNKWSHGQNLSSTSGEAEPFAQRFCENLTPGHSFSTLCRAQGADPSFERGNYPPPPYWDRRAI